MSHRALSAYTGFVTRYKMRSFSGQLLLALFAFVVAAKAAHLPDFIVPCKKDDPNLNQCAKDQANKAIPHLINGVKEFQTPSLNPLLLPAINIQASNNLDIKLKDCVLHGLEHIVVDDVNFDLKNQHASVVVRTNLINLLSQYEIKGRILVIPIEGQGASNITCVDGTFNYSFDYKLVDHKGQKYIELVNPKVKYQVARSYYHFDNLFNGDKTLGDETNRLLNENWRDVSKDLSPTVSETINQIATAILKAFFDRVPFEEIFV